MMIGAEEGGHKCNHNTMHVCSMTVRQQADLLSSKVTGRERFSDKEFVRYSVKKRERWKGSIKLRVTPVRIGECSHLVRGDPIFKELGPPPSYKSCGEYEYKHKAPQLQPEHASYGNLSQPKLIDICSYLGHAFEDNDLHVKGRHRISKLYFSTNTNDYPPPRNLKDGGGSSMNANFQKLKYYIQTRAHACGSPVICNGGNNKFNCKDFVCKNDNRRRKKNAPGENEEKGRQYETWMRCPFTFRVCWDEIGYYIPLLTNWGSLHNNGCSWHCCSF